VECARGAGVRDTLRLTRKSIRRGSFATVRSLVRHIQSYIDHWNDNPTPFIWTKEPADIIRKALHRGR